MPNPDEVFTITVKVLGSEFKFPVRRSDEEYFRQAVKLIEKTYQEYTKRFSSANNDFKIETYLKLVALDFGVRLKKKEATDTELMKSLEQLEKDVDEALN